MIRPTTLLNVIENPDDSRRRPDKAPRRVADERRSEAMRALAVTRGLPGARLAGVELMVALRHAFDTPRDRLGWHVGHQAYPHKIMAAGRDRIRTLCRGGLSGVSKRDSGPALRTVPIPIHGLRSRDSPCPELFHCRRQKLASSTDAHTMSITGGAFPDENVINLLRAFGKVEVSTLGGREEHIEPRLSRELATA